MLSAVNNQPINQRKRSIIQANYSGKSEEEEEKVGEEDVLIHSVSCEFADDDDDDDNAAEGLRRRKKKKQRHEDERGDDMTEDDVVAAPPSSSSSSSQTKKEQHQRSASPPPSVVPLSMQLFRPFWSLSCCPDCNVNPMGNHHRRRMQQDDAFLMDGGSPPSIGGGGGGVLDTRLRSVSMTSLKGIGISSSSASSTITSGVKLSNHPDHFKSSTEEDDDEEEEDDDDENDGVATSVAHASFLPSSSSSLESTKHSPSPSSSDVLLDAILPNRMSTGLGGLRNDDPRRLLITPTLSTTVNTTATSSSSAALANTVTIEQLLHEYTTACTIYGCHNRINPGVLTTLRYQLPTLRVSGNFFDADMLALSEILIRHCNGALKYITRLDFSIAAKEGKSSSFGGGSGNGKRGFRSHGAYALAKVLGMSEYIEEVYLMGNHVGPFGASAIFTSIGKNERTVLKTLLMRGCRIGERGALSFVTDILERNTPKTTKDDADGKMKEIVLEEVDFSANRIGFHGCYEIERALLKSSTTNTSSSFSTAATATSSSSSPTNTTTTTVWTPSGVKISASAHSLHVDLEANLVFQEVMNCITHGLGIILAIIGSILLSTQVNDKPTHYINSCAIYSTSLIVLFSCSTLYHSFFALNRTRFIFRVFDRCAIYMLIGGSYSPLLNIALQKHEYTKLLWFIYTCGSCGIVTEATLWKWKHKPKFSLAMYMGMGWSCLVCLPDLIEALPIEGVWLLALGGVAYTSGVPFFVRNTNLDHSIWHMFVLVGSVLHWLCVYLYVARLPIVG